MTRIGLMNCNPIDLITEAIKEKPEKFLDYNRNTDLKKHPPSYIGRSNQE